MNLKARNKLSTINKAHWCSYSSSVKEKNTSKYIDPGYI